MVWFFIFIILFAILACLIYSAVKEDKVKCEEYKTKCKDVAEESSDEKIIEDFKEILHGEWYAAYKVFKLSDNFNIGNVYFEKTTTLASKSIPVYKFGSINTRSNKYVFGVTVHIKSYVKNNGTVYDNGSFVYDLFIGDTQILDFYKHQNFIDLYNYIVNNLDKVKEVFN